MIQVFKNKEAASKAVADRFVQIAQEAIAREGKFTVALTGGTSPIELYERLAEPAYSEKIDWQHTFVFWGDERWVPLTDDRSNAQMAFKTLLNQVPIPKANIYVMYEDQATPEAFAAKYEDILRKHFRDKPPQFDLILLGMGDDGHTASLFPETAVLEEEDKWVVAYYLPAQEMYRVTLTAPLINQAQNIDVLVFGLSKSSALFQVLEGPHYPTRYPAQLIKPLQGELTWFVDEAATAMLNEAKGE